MTPAELRRLPLEELLEIVEGDDLSSAAAAELFRRDREACGPDESDDAPSDFLADRACGAWERSRDRVAEGAR